MKYVKQNKVYGKGITTTGLYLPTIKRVHTKEYSAWKRMLQRCYSEKYHETHPTYKECEVCDEWLSFQAFAEWYDINTKNITKPFHLDKDLKVANNKIYSPDTCMIIPQKVNQFLNDKKGSRGKFMIGVSFCKTYQKFRSQCMDSYSGKHTNIGLFDSEILAHEAWRDFKSMVAGNLASEQRDDKIKNCLLSYKIQMKKREIYTDGFYK